MKKFKPYLLLFVISAFLTVEISFPQFFWLSLMGMGVGANGDYWTAIKPTEYFFISIDILIIFLIAFLSKRFLKISFIVSLMIIVTTITLIIGGIFFEGSQQNKKAAEFWSSRKEFYIKTIADFPTSIDIENVRYTVKKSNYVGYDFVIYLDANIKTKFDDEVLSDGIRLYLNDVKGSDRRNNYSGNWFEGCFVRSDTTRLNTDTSGSDIYPAGKYSLMSFWNFQMENRSKCFLTDILNFSGQKIYIRGPKDELIKVVTIDKIEVKNQTN